MPHARIVAFSKKKFSYSALYDLIFDVIANEYSGKTM